MAIKVEEKRDVVVFAIDGKFMGGGESLELTKTLNKWVEKGFLKVVIDFSNLKWANSAGIGVIVSCYLTMKRLNGDLRITNLTDRVHYYFHISKLDTVFKIFDTVGEAVSSFSDSE